MNVNKNHLWGGNMTDTLCLREELERSGISITFIAKKMGISREGLYNKLNNQTEFKASEIVALSEILNLSTDKRDKIFFAS